MEVGGDHNAPLYGALFHITPHQPQVLALKLNSALPSSAVIQYITLLPPSFLIFLFFHRAEPNCTNTNHGEAQTPVFPPPSKPPGTFEGRGSLRCVERSLFINLLCQASRRETAAHFCWGLERCGSVGLMRKKAQQNNALCTACQMLSLRALFARKVHETSVGLSTPGNPRGVFHVAL